MDEVVVVEVEKTKREWEDAYEKAIEHITAIQEELLLGGGTESTELRRKRQANAGVTSDAESITESLRRSRQLMVQEVERSTNTLVAFDESTGVLKKAESEYKGHRSLLSRTRNLLSTMQRQDVIDRVILIIGFFLFACAVLYVVSKRIGILRLQQMATAAIKARLAGKAANGDATPLVQQFDGGNTVPNVNIHIQQRLHDEL
uniref:Sec20 C-terminal domain-containing protein n=1 Tax=Brassica campestris TaxID=3711 RepID=M4CCL3_BRACM